MFKLSVGKCEVMRCMKYVTVGRMHETKWQTVIGSGLFQVPGVTSGSRRKM